MLMMIAGAAAVLTAVLLAVFDVFWPMTVAAVLALVLAWWLGHMHAVLVLLRPEFIAAYVVAGFVWVFFRWARLVERELREQRSLSRSSRRGQPLTAPKWSEHSYEFAAYFFYWPIDAVAYLLSDLVQEAWEFVARMVSRSFDRYAEWRFGKATAVDAVDPHDR